MPPFVTCSSCGCAAKLSETTCPHCGEKIRSADGGIPRTAAALLLGLVTVAAGCGDDGSGGAAPEYGVPGTGGGGGQVADGGGAQGGSGQGGSGQGGDGDGGMLAPEYGVPGTGGGGTGGAGVGGGHGEGGFAAEYGVPGT
ncbi:MAG: hypothetical protein HOW73_08420 [Polyangiaceae bacterium]|nr:hypothetical protein [Polyangiaceae bacterium]